MSLWDSLMGVEPEQGDGLPDLPADRPTGREARNLLAAQQLEDWRNLTQEMTAVTSRLQGFLSDQLLRVETVLFASNNSAVEQRGFRAECGAVVVRNLSPANPLIVTIGGSSGSTPPTSGVGVAIVLPTMKETIAVGNTQFTLWGTAGDKCWYQAFARGVLPVG